MRNYKHEVLGLISILVFCLIVLSGCTSQGTTFYTKQGGFYNIAWSPDGKKLAVAIGSGNTIQVWQASDGHLLQTLSFNSYYLDPYQLVDVAWSPNGKYIAAGSSDGQVGVWDALSGEAKARFDHISQTKGYSLVAWSPDSTKIAIGNGHSDDSIVAGSSNSLDVCKDDGTVQVVSASDGSRILAYMGHHIDAFPNCDYSSSSVISLAWSPDGKYIASQGTNVTPQAGMIQVWNASTGSSKISLEGDHFAWSPDSKYIAVPGDVPPSIDLVSARDGTTVHHISTDLSMLGVAWSPDGKYIAAYGQNKVQILNAKDGNIVYTYSNNNQIFFATWSPDSQRIASLDYEGANPNNRTVTVWQAE